MNIGNNIHKVSIKKQPSDIDNHINKGNYYLNAKQWKSAKSSFENALLCDYKNFEANKGKLFSEFKVTSFDEICQKNIDITKYNAFNILIENANDQQKNTIEDCVNKFEEYKFNKKRKRSKCIKIVLPSLCALLAIVALVVFVLMPKSKFNNFEKLLKENKIEKAISYYEKNDMYISNDKATNKLTNSAQKYETDKDYINAAKIYNHLGKKRKSFRMLLFIRISLF